MSDTVLSHKWTDLGLGNAPFKVVGMYSIPSLALAEANPTAYNNALAMMPKGYGVGSCHVCGMPLTHNYLVKSKDDHRFVVGCDCVQHSGDHKLITKVEAMKKAEARKKRAIQREVKRIKRYAETQARIERERNDNWGFTHGEAVYLVREALIERKRELLYPVGVALADGKGGFRDSVAWDLKQGSMPWGRGRDIALGILEKENPDTDWKSIFDEVEKLS